MNMPICICLILMNSIQIQKVSIVSQVIGEECFTTDAKEILADDWVVMFPLIEALKDGERVYIMS